MNRKYWLIAVPLLIGAAPQVDTETRKDLRCFLAISSLATNPDPKISMSALVGAQYYLGRIDGRVPRLDLERALLAEAAAFTVPDLQPLLQSCGKQIQERGETVKGIGERMQAPGAHSSSSSS